MSRTPGLAPTLALFALTGACDVFDFRPILEPEPEPPPASASVLVTYHDSVSLEATVLVELRSWLPHEDHVGVTVDGRDVPVLASDEVSVRFGDTWRVDTAAIDDLPEVLSLPPPSGDPLLLSLPVLLRDGPRTVCVGADDPVLRHTAVARPEDLEGSWQLVIFGEDATLHLRGSGAPPTALRVPRELLGPLATPHHARLDASMHGFRSAGGHPVGFSAHHQVEWSLVGEACGPDTPG